MKVSEKFLLEAKIQSNNKKKELNDKKIYHYSTINMALKQAMVIDNLLKIKIDEKEKQLKNTNIPDASILIELNILKELKNEMEKIEVNKFNI